jgi:phage tail sheath protein FI
MVQVTYPGVYVQEIPSGFRAISGVSTSIAAFVGMAKRGPLLTPTRVLGLKDYERIFSADTSQGEMTEQVRQFFINKGEQAIIVRVARDADPATVILNNAAAVPVPVLTLTSRDAGLDANQIRARVDYNTPNPERTFNLTLFRETFNSSGVAQVSAAETHADLGMNPNGPRYAPTIINDQSQLVTAEVNTGNVNAAATLLAFSASANIYADNAAVVAAGQAPITAGGWDVGRFQIKVGNTPWLTVEVEDQFGFGDIEAAIDAVVAQHTTATVSIANIPGGGGLLRIVASPAGNDVQIARSPQFDIAQALGLGVAQGGIEVGSHAAARPAPSGLVSDLDAGVAGDLAALLNFGGAAKGTLDDVGVAGAAAVHPFTVDRTAITYPSGAGNMNQGTNAGLSLLNIRENLQAIANALSAGSSDWRAEVHGYRLALIPTFGSSSSGQNATFTSATPSLSAANQIFNAITGARAAFALGGADDGDVARGPEYDAAYQQLDERVDLFNLLILPKSAGDTGDPSIRSTLWGAASSFCQRQRAFLIADIEPGDDTPDGVLAELPDFRTGVVKDHAAVWWPRVTISSDGVRKNIDPSGSIAGVMARIDGSRGVWKAPAGLEADIRGVLGVEVPISDAQNGLINPEAVNAVRSFPAGVVSWGARTMDGFDNSGNTDYRYVPVRRFALFIEESLVRGLRFAIFEPNDEPLWAQIRLAAGAFMNGLFRRGAFAGQTTRDAYFVKCDAETTTPQDQALGVVNVLVGFAPLRPAEFIVITVQQMAGQVQV